MSKFKKPFLFTLVLIPIAIVSGYLTVQMSFSTMDSSILDEAIRQLGSKKLVLILSTIQIMIYAVLCGFFGASFSMAHSGSSLGEFTENTASNTQFFHIWYFILSAKPSG